MTSTPLAKTPAGLLHAAEPLDLSFSPSLLIKQLVSLARFDDLDGEDLLAVAATPQKKPAVKASKAPNRYHVLSVLGSGSFAKVFLAENDNVQNGKKRLVAIKAVDRALVIGRNGEERVFTEVRILRTQTSPFICPLWDTFKTPTKLCLVLELQQGGELYELFHRVGRLDASAVRFYAAQCILALKELHRMHYAYRDLKLENIMIHASGNIKLCDMGLCKAGCVECDSGSFSFVGTIEYLAPELLAANHQHGLAVDWWALGVLIYELLDGLPPFYSKNKDDMLHSILTQNLRLKSSFSRDAKKLLERLLDKNPKTRLGSRHGARDIMQSPFFSAFSWKACEDQTLTPPYIPSLDNSQDLSHFDSSFTSLSLVNEEVHGDVGSDEFWADFTSLSDGDTLLG